MLKALWELKSHSQVGRRPAQVIFLFVSEIPSLEVQDNCIKLLFCTVIFLGGFVLVWWPDIHGRKGPYVNNGQEIESQIEFVVFIITFVY